MVTVSRIEKETRKRKILIVDDEKINSMLLGKILGDEYEISFAENGKKVLDVITAEYKTLSIILLDLLMPEMNGYELLEILVNDKRFKNIPVIVMTSEKTAEIKSLQLGAVDFIPKPYDMPEVIKARIKRSIKLAEENSILTDVENESLTRLYNKEFFVRYVNDLDMFHPELVMDTAFININRFHLVNELYGHKTGNVLLQTTADAIRLILQKNIGLACRCDADTFYLYIAHQNDPQELFEFICSYISKECSLPDISIRVGIYQNSDKGLTVAQRIDRASVACNKCRITYSSSFACYDNDLHEKELFGEKLIRDTDKALAEKQFKVFFQPKYNIEGDKPVLSSAEALIRWVHPEHGMISPGIFIPLFEKNGLIQKLDHYVWNETAACIKKWRNELGIDFRVSVNVSRVDIFDPELENKLLDIVNRNGLDTGSLMLEITESAYSGNNSQIIEVVKRLRDDGFVIEMDDFGSGYSSLNMLTSLPIDVLKLDMGFVRKMCDGEKNKRMVEIILEIAKFLSVPVIAEGVETVEQYKLLKSMGCNVIQGYYFSKPLPLDLMEKKIMSEGGKL